MTLLDSIKAEFAHETQTTRPHLERLPEEKFDWRPHEKSYTAGALASHIVECVGWADAIFNKDELDINPATFEPRIASSAAELLQLFDQTVATGGEALARTTDASLERPWRMKIRGNVRFERRRADAFRDFTLSHLIHHRGQLSVYLRLLNVAVPGSYGPTADEQF